MHIFLKPMRRMSTGRIFMHFPREIYLEAQGSESGHVRKGTGGSYSLKQGSKMNICTLSGQTYANCSEHEQQQCLMENSVKEITQGKFRSKIH